MSMIIRLEDLPLQACSIDIRRFFQGLQIPDEGVYIIRGERGGAFITFDSDDDTRQAMQKDGGLICQQPVKLFSSSKIELQNVVAAAEGKLPHDIDENQHQQKQIQTKVANVCMSLFPDVVNKMQQQQKPNRTTTPLTTVNSAASILPTATPTASSLAPANLVLQLLPSNLSNLPPNVLAGQDSTETATLRHIFSDTSYFLMKSINEKNISLAKDKGVWSTPPKNEKKINQAFRDHRNVILIFSINESKEFQGFARVSCEARRDSQPVHWSLPSGMSNRDFEGVLYIDWITRRSLPFNKTSHLFNWWNENKPVKRGRDGQEIEPRCAEALCRLFQADPAINIMAIAIKAKKNKKRYSSRSQSPSPLPINIPPSLPNESPSLSSVIIKRQISKNDSRRSSPNNKHRSMSSDISSRHSKRHCRHRSPSNHDHHRHHQPRRRERNSQDLHRKRRQRSDSSHSDHDRKSKSNRKHTHRNNGDQSPYNNTDKTMSKIVSSGTYEGYINPLTAIHTQYPGFGTAMFSPGGYPMGYNLSRFYSIEYDHRGMPIPLHGGGYDIPINMYLSQPVSSTSSHSRNPTDYEQEINAFLRHTTTASSYQTKDNSSKSHQNHCH